MPTSNVFEGPGGRKMFWTDPKGAGAQAAAKPVASPSGGGVAPTIAKRKLKKPSEDEARVRTPLPTAQQRHT